MLCYQPGRFSIVLDSTFGLYSSCFGNVTFIFHGFGGPRGGTSLDFDLMRNIVLSSADKDWDLKMCGQVWVWMIIDVYESDYFMQLILKACRQNGKGKCFGRFM